MRTVHGILAAVTVSALALAGCSGPDSSGSTPASGSEGQSGQSGASALAAYLQIGKRGKVRVDGYDKDAKVARARADALKAALVAGGVPAGQVQAAGKTAGASAKKAAEVIVAP